MRQITDTPPDREPFAQLTDRALATEVTTKARCAESTVDPDEWFPVSADAGIARREAAPAIAICTVCPVRSACLELSLRHWTIGQHGVWGGLVAADRAALRVARLRARRRLRSVHLGPHLGQTSGNGSGQARASSYGRTPASGWPSR